MKRHVQRAPDMPPAGRFAELRSNTAHRMHDNRCANVDGRWGQLLAFAESFPQRGGTMPIANDARVGV